MRPRVRDVRGDGGPDGDGGQHHLLQRGGQLPDAGRVRAEPQQGARAAASRECRAEVEEVEPGQAEISQQQPDLPPGQHQQDGDEHHPGGLAVLAWDVFKSTNGCDKVCFYFLVRSVVRY